MDLVVPSVAEEEEPAPSFSVSYISPVDHSSVVSLTCKESLEAKATAFCTGNYTTTPEAGASEGFGVKVECEIKYGARSGPGCFTTVEGPTGPDTEKTYTEHSNQPAAKGPGPVNLRSWDQQYLAFVRVANPTLYSTLITPSPTNPEPAMSPSEDDSSGTREDESSDDRALRSMLKEMLARQQGDNTAPPPNPKTCASTDWKCRVLRLEMLTPPKRSQVVPNLTSVPPPASVVHGNTFESMSPMSLPGS